MIFRKKIKEKSVETNLLDFSQDEMELFELVRPFTMTSPERVKVLSDAVKYLVKYNIAGDFVECGVWRGGSILAMLKVLKNLNKDDRELYLFDTFQGMPPPTDVDIDLDGKQAIIRMDEEEKRTSWIWGIATIEEVKNTLSIINYPNKNIHFIPGKVEDTLKNNKPKKIALLRLDTDWYESTKVELEELYDNVVSGGIIIVDDYGHWEGCRKAVDEFIDRNNLNIFLNRIDYTGRLIIKP